MSADVQLKTYYPYHQNIIGDRIEFYVESESKCFILSDTGIEEGTSLNTIQSLKDFVQPYESDARPERESIKYSYDLIQEHLLQIFSQEQEFERLVSTLFILGTYTFQRFDAYPNLWLCIPRIENHQKVERIFKHLCFNGITIMSSFDPEAITACIEYFHPTLLIQQNGRAKSYKNDFLYWTANSKENIIPTKQLKCVQLYCPKLVLSRDPTPTHVRDHTLTLIINNPIESISSKQDFKDLRDRLCIASIKIQNGLTKNLSNMHLSDIFDALKCLAKTLIEFRVITELQYDSLENELKQRRQKTKHNVQFTFENDVLLGISQCLKQINLINGYISLVEIVEFLKEIETIGENFSPRLLSRLINKYQLLDCAPKRSRQKIDKKKKSTKNKVNPTKGNVDFYEQVTKVKINGKKLERLISTDITYY